MELVSQGLNFGYISLYLLQRLADGFTLVVDVKLCLCQQTLVRKGKKVERKLYHWANTNSSKEKEKESELIIT